MKDPEIAKAFGNPKFAPITKKIMADPSCLMDPMNYFKEELAADENLAKVAKQLLPKLAKLMPQSIPSPRSDSSDGEHKSTSSNSDSIIESQQRENEIDEIVCLN